MERVSEHTKIAWTKSTFNPWIGCTKVGPGCDGCYAEALDKRMRFAGATHWGAGVPRHRTSETNWKAPVLWNAKQTSMLAGDPGTPPWRVFCASLADVFDNDVPDSWRGDLFRLIEATPNLSWLVVTKRIGNVSNMVVPSWPTHGFPHNARLLITVCNQEEADRDIQKLLALPCKNGVSYEPALGPVDWSHWLGRQYDHGSVPGPHGVGGVMCPRCQGTRLADGCNGLEWIICGGESAQAGHAARPFDLAWARSTVEQCKAAGAPVFVKQIGSNPLVEDATCSLERAIRDGGYTLKDRAGADPAEWPPDLQIREFPR